MASFVEKVNGGQSVTYDEVLTAWNQCQQMTDPQAQVDTVVAVACAVMNLYQEQRTDLAAYVDQQIRLTNANNDLTKRVQNLYNNFKGLEKKCMLLEQELIKAELRIAKKLREDHVSETTLPIVAFGGAGSAAVGASIAVPPMLLVTLPFWALSMLAVNNQGNIREIRNRKWDRVENMICSGTRLADARRAVGV